jgi:hypothetical protein
MSLKDQIEGQAERRRELEATLNALAAEYVEQMQAFGKEPETVMDATGQYNFELGGAYLEDTHIIEYRPTPVQAWGLSVKEVLPHHVASRCLAITTTGELLLTEAHGMHFTRFELANGYRHPEGGALVYADASLYIKERMKSWQGLRERDQRNKLIEWAERVHLHGLDVIIRVQRFPG